jgi:excisionase family DNA binding protein
MEARMLPTTRILSAVAGTRDNGEGQVGNQIAEANAPVPAMVACFILMPQQAESLISLLKDLASGATDITQIASIPFAFIPDSKESVEAWLSHADAARYLGISKSTLYRHAEQGQLESRKFCGRLQYRASTLERFKNQHLRSARRSSRDGAIIGSAPTSGKC